MKMISRLLLLFAVLVLSGCNLFQGEKEYVNVYVKPDTSGLADKCSTSKLDQPPTKDYLYSLRTDEARFIYVSGLYIQSIGAFGSCIKESNGVIKYVKEIDKKPEEPH